MSTHWTPYCPNCGHRIPTPQAARCRSKGSGVLGPYLAVWCGVMVLILSCVLWVKLWDSYDRVTVAALAARTFERQFRGAKDIWGRPEGRWERAQDAHWDVSVADGEADAQLFSDLSGNIPIMEYRMKHFTDGWKVVWEAP